TPLLAARWLKEPLDEEALAHGSGRRGPWTRFSAAWERGYGRLRQGYGRLIRVTLRVRGLVVLIGVAALALSIAFIQLGWLGTEFTPQEDNSQFSVSVRMPIGTPLDATQRVVDAVDAQIRQMPGVVHTYASSGSGGGFFGSANTNSGSISVDLRPVGQRPPIASYLGRVRALARKYPEASIITSTPSALRIGGQRAVGVVVVGPDIATVNQLATQLATRMQQLPGVTEVRNEAAQSNPELSVQVDRQRAADLGID